MSGQDKEVLDVMKELQRRKLENEEIARKIAVARAQGMLGKVKNVREMAEMIVKREEKGGDEGNEEFLQGMEKSIALMQFKRNIMEKCAGRIEKAIQGIERAMSLRDEGNKDSEERNEGKTGGLDAKKKLREDLSEYVTRISMELDREMITISNSGVNISEIIREMKKISKLEGLASKIQELEAELAKLKQHKNQLADDSDDSLDNLEESLEHML